MGEVSAAGGAQAAGTARAAPATELDPELTRIAESWAAAQPLAGSGQSADAAGPPPPATRLARLTRKLREAHQRFGQISAATEADSYAAQWFLDNYYLIREAIREVAQDLPADFYRQLPRIAAEAERAGAPRARVLAWRLLEDSGGRLDLGRVTQLLEAYQRRAPLTMGELWALPSLLRLGLLEWLAESAELVTSAEGVRGEHAEHDQRVADCVAGLRTIKTTDWNKLFEVVSLCERELRRDAARAYAGMTFETRDRYRKVVERLSRRSGKDELEVARAAVRLSEEAAVDPSSRQHARHVGFYLVDEGVGLLQRQIGYRRSSGEVIRAWVFAHPTLVYLGSIGLVALLLLLWGTAYAASVGASPAMLVLAALLLLVPALTVAVAVVNYVLGHTLEPRVLPKLDFRGGIPAGHGTAVVMPVLFGSREEIDDLFAQLERHYLGNPDSQLRFALLSDFPDAKSAEMPGDAELIAHAKKRVQELNARHRLTGPRSRAGAPAGQAAPRSDSVPSGPFYLLHRGRRWNAGEGAWMGWERKRGKLMELNRLLRGADDTSYEVVVGDLARLRAVEYVLTLDADTRLPPGAAHRLVGTLAHPLNRAEFDEAGHVHAGYSLLQPRTDVLPESANVSRFSRLFVGENGIDLYTLAVSDVYQDLFGAAIFVGKGLYRVDDFQRALEGRVPENSLLSHDLLEGIYGKVALVSDVVLYEDYPPTYLAQVQRAQRWVRGDWQLLPWLLATLFGARGGGQGERLGAAGAWKIADNLRRSLLTPVLLVLFVAGWTFLPGSALVWTLIALSTLAAPLLANAVIAFVGGLLENSAVPGRRRLAAWQPLSRALVRFVISLSFVPYEASVVAVSIVITLYRLLVTRRNLLSWRTAAETNRESAPGLLGTAVRMAWALAITAAALALVALTRPTSLEEASVVLLLWLLSPVTAYLLSRSTEATPRPFTSEQKLRLYGLARRTWLYFEQFCGPEDNWLPPDNVQLGPEPVIAHRTSPTNIGLMLLSTMSAYDLGYVGAVDLSLRLRQTLAAMGNMQRYRGHLLNWYDTRSLQPLTPRYVSSVDSGNLVAALIAVRQGCLRLLDEPIDPAAGLRGLADTLWVLEDVLLGALPAGAPLTRAVAALRQRVAAGAASRERLADLAAYLASDAWPEVQRDLVAALDAGELSGADLTAVRLWAGRVQYGIRGTLKELGALAPWVSALAEARPWAAALPEGSPAKAAWRELERLFRAEPSLRAVAERATAGTEALARMAAALPGGAKRERAWVDALSARLASARKAAAGLVEAFDDLIGKMEAETNGPDFSFLYDPSRRLLHIGYNVDAERLDGNHYDLLASESRLASLVAVAKHDLPVSHWLHLGRPLGDANGEAVLLSWSGTMFEYLMPPLLTRRYGGTLIEQSCDAAVEVQIAYGKRHGVPWGVSESGYARVDVAGNYQYRAFGVAELALDRTYTGDLVVSPYATVLALPYRPQAVLENVDRLVAAGALGPHGFYEALDFTASRKPLGAEFALVRSHMAHHQGMILVALANALTDDAMVERFHSDPRIGTVELLLQERIPHEVPVVDEVRAENGSAEQVDLAELDRPFPVPTETKVPLCHLLSNGRYTVCLSAAGGGWSSAGDVAITRWRPDPTRDADGMWLFISDEEDGSVWSVTRQPVAAGQTPPQTQVTFHPFMVEYRCEAGTILTRMEVAVGQDEVELRRVAVVNRSGKRRRLRLTSYAEVVLGSAAADARHPAFSKLFVESSFDAVRGALVFRRRPRSSKEHAPFAAHMLLTPPGLRSSGEFESDRAAFLGRGNDVTTAAGLRGPLKGGVGATLDPIMALSQSVELPPHSQLELTFVTAFAESRRELAALLDAVRRPGAVAREFDLARIRSRLEMRQHELTPEKVELYNRLHSALVYPTSELRAPAATLAANTLGQSGLWGQGISGDYPILLVRLESPEELPLVVEALRAHAFWRRRGVKVDLVVLNAKDTAYDQALHGRLRWYLSRTGSDEWLNARGGIYLLRQDQLAPADLTLLQSTARVVLDGRAGSMAEQLAPLRQGLPPGLPLLVPARAPGEEGAAAPSTGEVVAPKASVPEPLAFDNGWGGFSQGGREYVIRAERGSLPPAPWSNVMANELLGCMVTEAGMGATWAVNSGENRLTPWSNDPVSDPSGEAVYLRDEETAEVWSPTPHPAGPPAPFEVRHGAGYTTYGHTSHGLDQLLEVSVAATAPVKLVRLSVKNLLARPRRVTVTYYAEWVLGVDRPSTHLHVLHDYDPERCVLLARNPYAEEFAGRVAFLASNKSPHGMTTDRREFLGRMGSPAAPDGLRRIGLSGSTNPGGDPCAALQLHLDLSAGGSEDVLFVLGQAEDRDTAVQLAQAHRDLGAYAATREAAAALWEERLGRVQVSTPDPALDVLTNGWLLYQTLSSRYFGRTAFYQPGGAYGFRDQLQDVMALLHAAPELAREQLLRAAAHQFEEGDVLHWWHPPSGRGVRTRISDDLLWLVYATERYVTTTGDRSVLSEEVPFLSGPQLRPQEDDRYDQYRQSQASGTLLEHCRRALERGATKGKHGLPLMGAGDWNDGMNRVGTEGKGESVWLAWFLIDVIGRYVRLLGGDQEAEREKWRARSAAYAAACEESAWDGNWYLRAFFDDGTPLGSHQNLECQIDTIAQSWAVLSGAAPRERALRAMRSAYERCVRREDELIQLFTPPFDRTLKDPGYIKGYLPGVRENGGQYTHGAIWTAYAFAELGDGATAHALYDLLNPVLHGADRAAASRYKVEPYVITADVYSVPPHVGRGGWSWYTGSAAWFYRLGIEGLLGLHREGDELRLAPCVPADWPGFEVKYRYGSSTYVLRARPRGREEAVAAGGRAGAVRSSQPEQAAAASGTGAEHASGTVVKLVDDGQEHVVEVGY